MMDVVTTQELVKHAAVDYQIIINIGVSIFGILLSTLLGVGFKMVTEVKNDLKEQNEKHHDLSVSLPTKYVAKNDFQYIIDALFAKLDKIEDKIDRKADKDGS